MNKEELKEILPHREPMLLIDEARRLDDTHASGSVTIRGDEWFLQGHFPGHPVVPGVILCEMIAQTCCITVLRPNETCVPYFAGINKLRFLSRVVPGDTLRLDCELTASRPPFYFAKAEGFVGGKRCVKGEFSFALMPDDKL